MEYRLNKRYDPPGICIYCGSTASLPNRLSDEHIIARSLGGTSILPEASCPRCAKITSYIEGYCANNIFNTLRVQRRLPTRRPRNRPSTLPTIFDNGGYFYLHMVAPKESIAAFPVYRFPPPQILQHRMSTTSYEYVQEIVVSSVESPLHLITYAVKVEARGAVGLAKRCNPFIFARMLAKIAHGYAVAEDALRGFSPLLPEIILGTSNKIPYLAGNLGKDEPIKRLLQGVRSFHHLRIGTMRLRKVRLCVVFIRLFAFLPTPTYTIVVGEKHFP